MFSIRPAFARAVGVQRAHRAIVAGVHRGQQVEAFRATDFPRMMRSGRMRRVLDQIADGDRTLAFEVGRAGFQRQPVRLLQAQFGRVFDGDTRSPGSIIFDRR
jgi:hypothetical protein